MLRRGEIHVWCGLINISYAACDILDSISHFRIRSAERRHGLKAKRRSDNRHFAFKMPFPCSSLCRRKRWPRTPNIATLRSDRRRQTQFMIKNYCRVSSMDQTKSKLVLSVFFLRLEPAGSLIVCIRSGLGGVKSFIRAESQGNGIEFLRIVSS